MHALLRATMATVLTVLLASATALVRAQDASPVKFNATYGVQTDSNLFRLPSSSALSTAETISSATVGVSLDTSQSLQRFELDANLVDYTYKNFGYLSFVAHNYDAAWRWSLTPHLTGNLTSSRKETLNSFTDTVGLNTRNQRTDTNTRFDADFAIGGPWHLLAGVAQTKQANQQALVAGGDYATTSGDLGVRHAFASGSAITYTARLNNGTYLNRALPNTAFLDDSFKQIDHDLRLRWDLGGGSTADANITFINRTHPTYGQRDFNGVATGARFFWAVTGKSALAGGYSHELAAYASTNTNYTQTDRINLGPVWQISPKTSLRLTHTWAQIAYLGSPTAALSNTRNDITRDTALTFSWQPYKQLGMSTAVQSASRGSNIANLDYDSTQLSFSASFNY